MATSGDVTVAQDGGQGNAKLHPYIVALLRWCVSCLWSTATVLLHRLLTTPLPPITAKAPKSRQAGKDHLDPEPKVECVVLHQPANHNLDVIFVHGLYGSLGNTWRQGEWRSKYHVEPEKVHLRIPTSNPQPCIHGCLQPTDVKCSEIINNGPKLDNNIDDNNDFTNIDGFYENIKRILPNEDSFNTEKFYNNTLITQVEVVDNYETQAKFVSDLFKNCDSVCDVINMNNNVKKSNNNNNDKYNNNDKCCGNETGVIINEVDCKCKINEGKKCDVGCGCVCDECYSLCWPRDWIKEDYPDARVISITYTSDPHLWRPLWVKESKRLRLHERAEQMIQQLLDLGVGEQPVVWVGHSKGGLFIKQIYCEAYEAYLKTNKDNFEQTTEQNMTEYNMDNEQNNLKEIDDISNENNINNCENNVNIEENKNNNDRYENNNDEYVNNNTGLCGVSELVLNEVIERECDSEGILKSSNFIEDSTQSEGSSDSQESSESVARLWSNSAGFMFYSVPHRGSPLADIKTPLTARSVELLEITKDCELVSSLQERWLAAATCARPAVRSVVETRRTLMSVLWLRIVSQDSADPGVGSLCGVSVDHREICKPSSRHCMLYKELSTLIDAALNKCRCL